MNFYKFFSRSSAYAKVNENYNIYTKIFKKDKNVFKGSQRQYRLDTIELQKYARPRQEIAIISLSSRIFRFIGNRTQRLWRVLYTKQNEKKIERKREHIKVMAFW